MPPEFTLTLDQQRLSLLRARLKAAGNKTLARELNRALREAAKPLAEAEKAAALALPAGRPLTPGGLREGLAAGVRVTVTSSPRNPGVRVVDRAKLAKAAQARGGIRHPVYGNRKVWAVTHLGEAHWFNRVAYKHRDDVRKRVKAAVDRIARKIAKG